MIWLSEIILILVTIGIAWWHSRLIKASRPIKHGWWGLLAGSLIAGGLFWVWPVLTIVQAAGYVLAQSIARLVVFNVALNGFRGLTWYYTSKTSTSLIDRLELRLFGGRVWVVEALLTVLFLIIQLFI